MSYTYFSSTDQSPIRLWANGDQGSVSDAEVTAASEQFSSLSINEEIVSPLPRPPNPVPNHAYQAYHQFHPQPPDPRFPNTYQIHVFPPLVRSSPTSPLLSPFPEGSDDTPMRSPIGLDEIRAETDFHVDLENFFDSIDNSSLAQSESSEFDASPRQRTLQRAQEVAQSAQQIFPPSSSELPAPAPHRKWPAPILYIEARRPLFANKN